MGYLWRKNGVGLIEGGGISGTTSAALTIANAQFGDAGSYDVLVTNLYGVTPSSLALLTVLPAPPPSITSVSLTPGGLSISGTGGMPGKTYFVLSSTNVGLPLPQWTPIATNVFDTKGNFSFTSADPPTRQRYFLLQLP